MAQRQGKLSVPGNSGNERTPSPSAQANKSALFGSATQVVLDAQDSGASGGEKAMSADAVAPTTASAFASFRHVSTVGDVRANASDGVSHTRTQSLPDKMQPRKPSAPSRIARLDDFRIDSSPEDDPVLETEFSSHLREDPAEAEGEEAAAASASPAQAAARSVSVPCRTPETWVTSEGVHLLSLAREFLYMSFENLGYSGEQLADAGLSVDSGRTSSDGSEPVERKIAGRLIEISQTFEENGMMEQLMDSLRAIPMNYANFSRIASELLRRMGRLSWGVVGAIFIFAQKICLMFVEKGLTAGRLLVWLGRFIVECLLRWIMEEAGGFMSLLEEPWRTRDILLVSGGVAALAGFLYWASQR